MLFLPAINAARFDSLTDGIDLKTISYLGAVFAWVDLEGFEEALDFLDKTNSQFTAQFAVHIDVRALSSTDDIVRLLDEGAAKVFVSHAQLEQLEQVGNISRDRLVITVTGKQFETNTQIMEAIGNDSQAVYIKEVEDVELLKAWIDEHGQKRPAVYVSLASSVSKDSGHAFSELIKRSAIPVIPAKNLTVNKNAGPDRLQVSSLLQISSDRPDGLLSTIVTDERGAALGLVYSTPESIQESLRTGRGVYQSRKRGLWYKGESSGDVQELIRIEVDCDHDCLKFIVRQKGRGTSVDINLWE